MLFIFGTLFKIQHWPVSRNHFKLIGTLRCFLFHTVTGFNKTCRSGKQELKNRFTYSGQPDVYCMLPVRSLRSSTGHMASLFMVLAVIILFIVVLPWYTWMTWKDERDISASFIFIIIGSLLIVVPGALINLNLRNMYNNGYYPHLEQEQRLFEVRSGMNKSFLNQYHDSLCYSKMDLLHKKTLDALIVLGNAEKKIVEASEATAWKSPNQIRINRTALKTEHQFDIHIF